MARLSDARLRTAQLSLLTIYLTLGHASLSVVAWVPEFIDRLNVSFATWGTIVGFGIIGTILPLLFASKLVMRFGSRAIIRFANYAAMFMLVALSWSNNPIIWFFINAGFAFALSLLGNAVNSHSVMLQKQVKKNVLGKIHAGWSMGAVAAAITGGAATLFIDLEFYLIVVAGFTIFAFEFALRGLLSPEEDGHQLEKANHSKRKFYKIPTELWLLCVGIFAGSFMEAVLVDWSAVFARDALSLEISLRSVPFAMFMVGMIIGRLSMSRMTKWLHPNQLAQFGSYGASVIMVGTAVFAPMLSQEDAQAGLLVASVLFLLAGLSLSAIAPAFFAAAGHIKGLSTSSALATMSLFTAVVSIGAKTLVGGLAEGVGLTAAFVFPALLLIIAGYIAGKFAKKAKASDLENSFPPTGPISVIAD